MRAFVQYAQRLVGDGGQKVVLKGGQQFLIAGAVVAQTPGRKGHAAETGKEGETAPQRIARFQGARCQLDMLMADGIPACSRKQVSNIAKRIASPALPAEIPGGLVWIR